MPSPIPNFLLANQAQIAAVAVAPHTVVYTLANWAGRMDAHAVTWGAFVNGFPQDAISRGDLFAFAEGTPNAATAPVLFLGSMVWGYGMRGYGPYRTDLALITPNLPQHLLEIFEYLTADNITAAYDSVQIQRCGSAFFTKLFYFYGRSRLETYPLILDSVIAAKFESLLGLNAGDYAACMRKSGRVASVGRNPRGYLKYLEDMHSWATQLQCEADQIELFLFTA